MEIMKEPPSPDDAAEGRFVGEALRRVGGADDEQARRALHDPVGHLGLRVLGPDANLVVPLRGRQAGDRGLRACRIAVLDVVVRRPTLELREDRVRKAGHELLVRLDEVVDAQGEQAPLLGADLGVARLPARGARVLHAARLVLDDARGVLGVRAARAGRQGQKESGAHVPHGFTPNVRSYASGSSMSSTIPASPTSISSRSSCARTTAAGVAVSGKPRSSSSAAPAKSTGCPRFPEYLGTTTGAECARHAAIRV